MGCSGGEPHLGSSFRPEREAKEGSLREDAVHRRSLGEADIPASDEGPASDLCLDSAGCREDNRKQGVEGPVIKEVCFSG